MAAVKKLVRYVRRIIRAILLPASFVAERAEKDALASQVGSLHVQLAEANQRIKSLQTPNPVRDSLVNQYCSRQRLVLLPRLLELIPAAERFTIVDGGARDVEADPRWRPIPPQRLRFVGFEPDAAEAKRLNALSGSGGIERKFVAAGLWGTTGVRIFEHNNIGGGSSFLHQNRPLTDRWKFENANEMSLASDIFFPLRQEPTQVVSLEDWSRAANIESVDFLKLNVQGGELEILRGAGPVLDNVLGILLEVAFVESYQDRPMFADIDSYLRKRGFTFFDLLAHHYVGRSSAPVAAQHLATADAKLGQLVSAWGQLVEGHALYLRDPITTSDLAGLPTTRVLKLAAIAEVFGQVEYAFEILNSLTTHLQDVESTTADALRTIRKEGAEEYARMLRPGTTNYYADRA